MPRQPTNKTRILITGGPGAGKTTLLRELQAHGYTVVDDSPRAIIRGRLERGLSPRPAARAFVEQTLRMDIANYRRHAMTRGPVFFDRGVLDALCGLDQLAPLSESELAAWLAAYPYDPYVFILPPWQAIYVNDAERDHTFAHAEAVYGVLREWYRRCRVQLIEVPRVSAAERCAYVLWALAERDAQTRTWSDPRGPEDRFP